MRKLYEKYWAIASELDKQNAESELFEKHKRWKRNHPRIKKGPEEFILMDRIVAAVDNAIKQQKVKNELNALD